MEPVFFSVIIPCYNAEKYLQECIASVSGQSFGSWEIVAVDDGSTDGTLALLSSLAVDVGPRMRVLLQENSGQMGARLAGLSVASGLYVLFLDSDDVLRPDAMELIHRYLLNEEVSIVQFRHSKSRDFGGGCWPAYEGIDHVPATVTVDWLRRAVCRGSSFNNLWNKAFKRGLLEGMPALPEYLSARNGEDLMQLVYALDSAEDVLLLDDVLYYYRPNQGSVTHRFQENMYDSVRTANVLLMRHAEAWGDPECVALCRARWLHVASSYSLTVGTSGFDRTRKVGEYRKILSDTLFADSYEAIRSLSVYDQFVLRLLRKGRYGTLTLVAQVKLVARTAQERVCGLIATVKRR